MLFDFSHRESDNKSKTTKWWKICWYSAFGLSDATFYCLLTFFPFFNFSVLEENLRIEIGLEMKGLC